MHHIRLSHRRVAIQTPYVVRDFFDSYQGTALSRDRTKVQRVASELMDATESPSPKDLSNALDTVIETILKTISQQIFHTRSPSSHQQSLILSELKSRNIVTLFTNDFHAEVGRY
jgi:hypothetical protein